MCLSAQATAEAFGERIFNATVASDPLSIFLGERVRERGR
jgi:hypothetical protein